MLAFVVGVSVAAMYGGFGPAMFATAVSLVIGTYVFVAPRLAFGPLTAAEIARLSLFTFEGLVIAWSGGRVRRHAERLENEVARRTSELQQSNEALETFAHTISHDIRAPLRSIRGFAEIIEEDFGAELPAQGRDYTQRIAAAAQRLDALVNNLLAYTRIGRLDTAPEPVSLDRLVGQAVADVGEDIERGGGAVRVQPLLGDVLGHRETLRLIIVNLLSNALKFVPRDRRPDIHVSAERRDGRIFLRVRDNGIGVVAADQQRIFQPFERLHARQVYAGSGLGLALVARGIERMNGSYGISSDGRTGSEFWIALPAAPGAPHVSTDPAR
jgi:signal transduction histidine kinase